MKKKDWLLMKIILKKQKNNPLLIGNAGVGKSALVEGLAYDFVNNNYLFKFSNTFFLPNKYKV